VNIKNTIAAINQMQADGVIQRYAIGGAVGATFYLEPVATLDVDVFVTFQPDAGGLLVNPRQGHADHRSTVMNADAKGLQARQMTALGEAPGWRFAHRPSPERARQIWMRVPPEPLREAFQAAIQSAQAAGYSDWLATDETALDYIATRIAPKFGGSDCQTVARGKIVAAGSNAQLWKLEISSWVGQHLTARI
jgi:hypothetical protein